MAVREVKRCGVYPPIDISSAMPGGAPPPLPPPHILVDNCKYTRNARICLLCPLSAILVPRLFARGGGKQFLFFFFLYVSHTLFSTPFLKPCEYTTQLHCTALHARYVKDRCLLSCFIHILPTSPWIWGWEGGSIDFKS